jgi:trans-aconitate methyltransferase
VLSDPEKVGGRWDPNDFLASGEMDVSDAFAKLDALGVVVRRGLALDFGCGAGRLTRALASRFEQAVGVDVSAPMIEKAHELNRDRANLRFRTITTGRLTGIDSDSFDFV